MPSYQTVRTRGPIQGMEWRTTHQTLQHCAWAINVEVSDGALRGRDGYRELANPSLDLEYSQLDYGEVDDGTKRLLLVGVAYVSANNRWEARAAICTLNGTDVSTVELTAALGEWVDDHRKWHCSFIHAMLSGHPVTLIVTPNTTYVYDGYDDPTTIRTVDMDEDALKGNSDVLYYRTEPPFGPISAWYRSRVFYAGFKLGMTGVIDKLPDEQDEVDENSIIGGDRKTLTFGPHQVTFSDQADPLGVQVNTFGTDQLDTIRALLPLGDHMAIVTDKNVWMLYGDPVDPSTRLVVISEGNGSAAPMSIATAYGAAWWMGHDGIYRFTGDGPAINVTPGIRALWTGMHTAPNVPLKAAGMLLDDNLRLPWTIDKSRLYMSRVMHLRDKNQLWFSLPIVGQQGLPVVLVYDYEHTDELGNGTVTLHCDKGLDGLFHDGLQLVDVSGRLRTFFCGFDGTDGVIRELQEHENDDGDGIHTVWCSPRFTVDEGAAGLRKARVRIRAWGNDQSTCKWAVQGDGGPFDVEKAGVTNTNRAEDAGEVTLHPFQGNSYFYGQADPECEYDTSHYSGEDWFDSRIDHGSLGQAKYAWLWLIDAPASGRRPTLVMDSWGFDVSREGRGRR